MMNGLSSSIKSTLGEFSVGIALSGSHSMDRCLSLLSGN